MLPVLFALGDKVLHNPQLATFAAFGSFALLLLVDFTGPMRERLQSQLGLGIVGAVFVCLGTLASQHAWLGAASMVIVGFGVSVRRCRQFHTRRRLDFLAAVVRPAGRGAGTSLGDPRPARRLGTGLGSSLLATWLLWPTPTRNPLRAPAGAACRALATRLRTDVSWWRGGEGSPTDEAHAQAVAAADESVKNLQRVFLATPYRPTGLSLASRTVVRLVDELNWLIIVIQAGADPKRFSINPAVVRRQKGCR